MAHLRPGDPDPTPAGRDRAQLLLLAGFALAAVFVAFAFLLNSVIYTENLATRGEAARTSQAAIVVEDTATGTVGVIEYANEHNATTYTALENELKSGTADIERLVGAQQLANGGVVSVEFESYQKGTWVNQSYVERNFTAGGDTSDPAFDEDWTLFDDADGVRAYRIHVTDPDKLENISPLDDGDAVHNFTVTATDGDGDTWTMRVFHDNTGIVDELSGDPYVVRTIDGDGDRRFCSVDGSESSFWINVSAGTVAGEGCRALRFGEDIGTVEEIRYENGHQVYGTYRLIAAQEESTFGSSNYNSTGELPSAHPNPPVTDPAIYNATIHVTYETDNLFYETDRVVEPEEGDDD